VIGGFTGRVQDLESDAADRQREGIVEGLRRLQRRGLCRRRRGAAADRRTAPRPNCAALRVAKNPASRRW
jgi:hypothetical protein